jgi:NitT/TauT family transport system substrate-binding protein
MSSAALIGRRLLLALLATLSAGWANAADPLRLGLLHTLSPAPFYIAQQRGYFRDQGIDLTFRFFEAAQPIAAAAVAGDIDLGVTALTGGFFNLAEKDTLKVIGGGMHEQPGFPGSAIIVSDKAYAAGLTAPDKLPGHSFAITQYGSSFHYMLGRIAEADHFDIGSVQLRPVQQVPNMLAAVESGQVDATIGIASQVKPLAESGKVHIIGWVGDIVPYQITAVFTTGEMIKQHADLLHRFATAYQKGVADYREAFLRKDAKGDLIVDAKTDAAIADIEKYVFTGDPHAREKILAGVGYYAPNAALDVADVGRQLAWFKAQGLVKGDAGVSDIVDTQFMPTR